jgi:hypothetical protein
MQDDKIKMMAPPEDKAKSTAPCVQRELPCYIGLKCSYKCGFYQDGAVFSMCNKYGKPLVYKDGKPLRCTDCEIDFPAEI